jgi:hypothetical protein
LFFQRSWHARFSSLIFSSHFSLFFARWTSSRAQTFRPTTDPWYSRRLRRRRRRDAFPSLFGEFECRSLHKGILRSPHTEYYLNADGGDVVGSMGRRAIVPRGEDFSRFEPARKFFTSRLDFDHLLIVINRWSSVCAVMLGTFYFLYRRCFQESTTFSTTIRLPYFRFSENCIVYNKSVYK